MKQSAVIGAALLLGSLSLCTWETCGAGTSANYSSARDYFASGGRVARSTGYIMTASAGVPAPFSNASSAGFQSIAMLGNVTPAGTDLAAPKLAIASPLGNSFTNSATLLISGTVSDPSGIKSLVSKGIERSVEADGSFSFSVNLVDGSNSITTVATDYAGNKATDTRIITLDRAAPNVTGFKVPSVSKLLTVPVTAFTATDNLKVAGYLIAETDNIPEGAVWKATPPTAYAAQAAGLKTLRAWVKDAAGNVSAAATAKVMIDDTRPEVTDFVVSPGLIGTLTVPIGKFLASDNSGAVAGYLITLGPDTPLASLTTWSLKPPTTFTSNGSGIKILYAWAKDAAGNVSKAGTATVNIDLTAPVVSEFLLPKAANTLSIPVKVTATDGSGVTGYLLTTTATAPAAGVQGWSDSAPTSYTFTSAGAKTLYAWAKDALGHVSVSKSATVTIDQSRPVVSGFSVRSPWNSLSVPVTSFTATDDKGVAGYLITDSDVRPDLSNAGWRTAAPTTYGVASQGPRTLFAWVKDAAGNISDARTAAVTIDNELPVVQEFTPGTALTNSLTIPIASFSATDNNQVTGYLVTLTSATPSTSLGSWSATRPKSFTSSASGKLTLYGWAKDSFGNVSKAATATVNIDKTLPMVKTFKLASPATSLTVPVTSFTASDNTGVAGYQINLSPLSSVAASGTWSDTPPASFTFPSTGSKTAYAWVKDGAGNLSAALSATTQIPSTVATTVSGKVTDASGIGLPNVGVRLYSTSASVPVRSAVTGATGAYSLAAVETGTYHVFFDGSALGRTRTFYNGDMVDRTNASPLVVTAPTPTTGVNAVLGKAGSISGRISFADGTGIAGVAVRTYLPGGGEVWGGSGTTDADGKYTLGGLSSGSYKVQFDGGAPFGVRYYDGKSDLAGADPVAVAASEVTGGIDATLAAVPASKLSGRVTDGSGLGVPGVRVSAYSAESASFVASTTSDADGIYHLDGVGQGTYKVLFDGAAIGFTRRFYGGEEVDFNSATAVAVSGASSVTGLDAYLTAGGSLTGRVTDEQGSGIAGVRIAPYRDSGTVVWGAEGVTDAEGYCTINGLGSGNYSLRFDGKSGSGAAVAVTAGSSAGFQQSLPIR